MSTEPDGIPCGLDELLRYRRNRFTAEDEHRSAEIRRHTQELRETIASIDALNVRMKEQLRSEDWSLTRSRELCDLMSAQLGKRVSARSSMPGSGAPARMAEPPKRTLMQRISAWTWCQRA